MNKISVKQLISSGNLLHSYHDYGCFLRKLLSNMLFQLLSVKQLHIFTIDINELLLNRLKLFLYQLISIAKAPSNGNNLTPNASINRFILPQKTLCCLYQSTPPLANNILVKPFDNSVTINPIALKKDFCFRKETYIAFSPKITDSIIKQAISQFQINIDNAIKYLKHICCYYS